MLCEFRTCTVGAPCPKVITSFAKIPIDFNFIKLAGFVMIHIYRRTNGDGAVDDIIIRIRLSQNS
jgi:hypothetical protein